MQLKIVLLGFFLSLFSVAVMAGGNHDHGHSHSHTPVNQETATIKAADIVAALIKREKLGKSWASVTANSVEKKVFKGNLEWVAIFFNGKISDPAKQKLYVFLTLGGDHIAVNYSGK